MYAVTINNSTTNVNTYTAAGATVKASVQEVVAKLRQPIRNGVFRSPKATARINADRLRTANKLEAAKVSLPKAAGNVDGQLPGLRFAILRK